MEQLRFDMQTAYNALRINMGRMNKDILSGNDLKLAMI